MNTSKLRNCNDLLVVRSDAYVLTDEAHMFAGLGDEISDDPDEPRDEFRRLRYPRWEPEFRLKLLRDLDEHQAAFLFWSPPAHKGSGTGGMWSDEAGRSLVVAPGSLADGHYAVADLHSQEVELGQFAGAQA